MEALLLAVLVVAVLSLAVWDAWRRLDPPYQGLHERRGRHRRPAWDERLEDLMEHEEART